MVHDPYDDDRVGGSVDEGQVVDIGTHVEKALGVSEGALGIPEHGEGRVEENNMLEAVVEVCEAAVAGADL
jgi:hypothetical protein